MDIANLNTSKEFVCQEDEADACVEGDYNTIDIPLIWYIKIYKLKRPNKIYAKISERKFIFLKWPRLVIYY